MKRKILVIAPHPDDETLGCGGTLLKHKSVNDELHYLTITAMLPQYGYSEGRTNKRQSEINEIINFYGFSSHASLSYCPATLEMQPLMKMVDGIRELVCRIEPEVVYLPYRNDIHSDHKIVFDASIAAIKLFRSKTVKKICCYETLSETEFSLMPNTAIFSPNYWVDITSFLNEKIKAFSIYESENQEYPLPRSAKAIEALASFRGVRIGVASAEAFMVLQDVW